MKNLLIGLAVGILIGIGIGYLIWGNDKNTPTSLNTSTKVSPDSKMSVSKDTINYDALLRSLDKANEVLDSNNISENAKFARDINMSKEILKELKDFSSALNAKEISQPIPYNLGVSRRDSFKLIFPYLATVLLPTYFEIESTHVRALLSHNPVNIRFYPVLEARPNKHLFTWAFIGANSAGDNIKDTVIDVINPCPPPPTGCKDLE